MQDPKEFSAKADAFCEELDAFECHVRRFSFGNCPARLGVGGVRFMMTDSQFLTAEGQKHWEGLAEDVVALIVEFDDIKSLANESNLDVVDRQLDRLISRKKALVERVLSDFHQGKGITNVWGALRALGPTDEELAFLQQMTAEEQ